MASAAKIEIKVDPEIREAINELKPVVRAATAYVDDPSPETFQLLASSVSRWKRYQRDSKMKLVPRQDADEQEAK